MVDQIKFNLYSPEHHDEEKEQCAPNEIKMAFNQDENEDELITGFDADQLNVKKQTSLNRLQEAWKYIDDEVAVSEPQYNLNLTKCVMGENSLPERKFDLVSEESDGGFKI